MATRRKRTSFEGLNVEKTSDEILFTDLEEAADAQEEIVVENTVEVETSSEAPVSKQEEKPRPAPAPRRTLFPKRPVESTKQRNVPRFS